MTIAICGSMAFAKQMLEIQKELLKRGINVFVPDGNELQENYKEAGTSEEAVQRKIEHSYIKSHYKFILQSDAILVLNYDKNEIQNYIGGNSFLEMGFAHVNDKQIYMLNPVPEMGYWSELCAMQPIILNGDLDKINKV
jgi:hypothetical protein